MGKGIKIDYPEFAKQRGPGYWLKLSNLWASRRKIFRSDHSNEWRYSFSKTNPVSINRTVAFSRLIDKDAASGFRFIILGDTGEGDRSQYALLPLIRELKPDFMVINGDVAYPAGRNEDFIAGFFEPYKGLNIPIWTVPGNHEYYSKHRGQEFHDIFCTSKWARTWEEYGLHFVQQPGTYWELQEPGIKVPLVVIGVDTGMTGDLDGYGVGNPVDREQLSWLNDRLKIAQKNNKRVIILFHIPALANLEFVKKTHLFQLHFLIAKYSCVRMVIGAHYHNYQQYTPAVCRRFLNDVTPASHLENHEIHYLVNGDGGASLTNTNFKKGPYPAKAVYPTAKLWKEYVKIGKRAADKMGLTKTLVGDIIGRINKDVSNDLDPAGLLSFLLVDIQKDLINVHPVFMDDVRSLFPDGASSRTVSIQDENQPVEKKAIEGCIQAGIKI